MNDEEKQQISDGHSIHEKRVKEMLSIIDVRIERATRYRENHKVGSERYSYFNGKSIAYEIAKEDLERIFNR